MTEREIEKFFCERCGNNVQEPKRILACSVVFKHRCDTGGRAALRLCNLCAQSLLVWWGKGGQIRSLKWVQEDHARRLETLEWKLREMPG